MAQTSCFFLNNVIAFPYGCFPSRLLKNLFGGQVQLNLGQSLPGGIQKWGGLGHLEEMEGSMAYFAVAAAKAENRTPTIGELEGRRGL